MAYNNHSTFSVDNERYLYYIKDMGRMIL